MGKTKKLTRNGKTTPGYRKNFSKAWLTDPELKDWVAVDHGGNQSKAYCKYCKTSLKAHHADLIKHKKTGKHTENVKWDKSAQNCQQIPFVPVVNVSQKTAEIKVSAFVAEHTSVNSVDHLSELLSKLDPRSNVFSKMRLHRTKCTMIIKNVIAPCLLQEIVEDVGDGPYSLIIDDSTDLSNMKVMCVIRFLSLKGNKIVTLFYRLIELFEAHAAALYDCLTTQMNDDGLKLKNLVGIGVDGASVMVGVHHSLAALLKKDIPDLVVMKCVCHSFHLCAEKACAVLPRKLEFLVREAHNWFSYSPKRRKEYENLYAAMNANSKPTRIAKLSGTRWLARSAAITTILDQWDELKLLFRLAKDDHCFAADQLFEIMNIPAYKCYLVFLKRILRIVCAHNELFQKQNVDPLKLYEDLLLFYKSFLKMITLPTHLDRVTDDKLMSFEFENSVMPASCIEFGFDFNEVTANVPPHELTDVKERCREFLVELCRQIRQRIPNNVVILQQTSRLHPRYATSQQKQPITEIANSFSRFKSDVSDIEVEWGNVSNKTWSSLASDTTNDNTTEAFWLLALGSDTRRRLSWE